MGFNIEKHVHKAHEFESRVAMALGRPDDKGYAARITTAFFHALRERISPEESLQFVAQLPMFLKAVYVDGWKLTKRAKGVCTKTAFLDEVRAKCPQTAGRDLGNDKVAEEKIRSLIRVLQEYITKGEMNDIRAQLPAEVVSLFQSVEVEGKL